MPQHAGAAALVTGCSTGIGRATALALHGAGFAVYATAREPSSIADLAAERLTVCALDVTDEPSMRAVVAAIESAHGALAVLVNNAGYALQGPAEETPPEDVRAIFDVNVFGLLRLTQLVLPGMRRAGAGRIINIGSMAGRFTFPGGGAYHATKHAVEALSDALRLEVLPFGVRVSLIEPGPVRSSFAATALGSLDGAATPYGDFAERLAGKYASTYSASGGGLLEPESVARVIVRAAVARRPRARYAVGVVARALITLRRALPDRLWDANVRRVMPVPRGPSAPSA